MIKKTLLSIFIIIYFTACANEPGETAILNVFTSADKFNNNNWFLDHKHYQANTPLAKNSDWMGSRSWFVAKSDSGHGVHLDLDEIGIRYHIEFYTAISPYSERDKAIDEGNEEALRKLINYKVGKITPYGEIEQNLIKIKHFGKESYPCTVREFYRPAGTKGYPAETYRNDITCYKFNPEKTKKKYVALSLKYYKLPNLPKELEELAKDYTYEDLKQRAQRMLDSLYIKDGW